MVTLARVADRRFPEEERAAIEHLADQAAVGLAGALAFERARRLAGINSVVLDATPDGILLVDTEGKPLLENAAMRRLAEGSDRAPEESVYDRIAQSAEQTSDPERFREAMEAIAADPEREAIEEFETLDGRAFQLYTTPVRDPDDGLIGRLLVLRDRTGEREAEKLKSELVATVSHELRTPLASVLGYAELLSHRELDEETRARYLGTIYSEAQRLTDLINRFLDLQRIEEGRFTLSLEHFDLAELLRSEVELFSAQSLEHELSLHLPDGALQVLGDRDRIAQVIANLLSNAIKYSPGGGEVRVSARASDGSLTVAVEDPGLGIPEDQQRRIFTKFFRADTSDTREIGGTGLGLALSKEIVEGHGGRIGFETAEGVGSTFWFTLPAPEPRQNGSGARRVLVIEDDPSAAALLAAYLREDGHHVEVAATGEQGAGADRAGSTCARVSRHRASGPGGRVGGARAPEGKSRHGTPAGRRLHGAARPRARGGPWVLPIS